MFCFALGALCACGDDTGGDLRDASLDGMVEGGLLTLDATLPAPSCGDFGTSPACGDCMAENCCTQGGACEASSACVGLVDCARDCPAGDNDCLGACVGDHPTGRGGYNLLVLCMGDQCLDDCPSPTP